MGLSTRYARRLVADRRVAAISMLLTACALTSCGSGDVDCEIDAMFNTSQQSEIQRAGKDWNAFTTRAVTFSNDGDWLIIPATVPLGLGLEQKQRRLIRISPSTPDDQVYAVALHELGHALGLRHVSQGVMDPVRQTIKFSDEDMAECRRAGACQ